MRSALIDPRIARMIGRDRKVATGSLITLWLACGFVFWRIAGLVGPTLPGLVGAVAIVGAGILFLNTMSIYAMLRGCSREADIARVYGPEIQCDQIEDCDPPNC